MLLLLLKMKFLMNILASTRKGLKVYEYCRKSVNQSKGERFKMKKNKGIVISVVVAVFMVVGILIYLLTPKKPSDEQLKKDFLEHIVKYEDVDISEIEIVGDVDLEEQYVAEVRIIYSDKQREFDERYCMRYIKEDEWVFYNYDKTAEDDWKQKAIAEPTEEELRCILDKEYEGEDEEVLLENGYAPHKISDESVSADLEKQTATYSFVRTTESPIIQYSEKCTYEYQYNKGWELIDSTTEVLQEKIYNYIHTWSGTATKQSTFSFEEKEETIQFRIKSVTDGIVEAELTQKNVTHQMKGTVGKGGLYNFKLFDVNDEKYYLEANIYENGELDGRLNTEYSSSGFIYLNKLYNIDLNID